MGPASGPGQRRRRGTWCRHCSRCMAPSPTETEWRSSDPASETSTEDRTKRATRRGRCPDGDPWEEVESVITSGSLIPLAAHAAIGPFREEFFIDHVDREYCFRARAKGFRVIKTRKPLMLHAIGAVTHHNVLWMNKWTSNHSPDRRYYIARNDTVMLREYGNYMLGLWALKSLSRCLRLCKRILLYEHMKTSKITAVVQGWWDGVCGHMGPRAQRRFCGIRDAPSSHRNPGAGGRAIGASGRAGAIPPPWRRHRPRWRRHRPSLAPSAARSRAIAARVRRSNQKGLDSDEGRRPSRRHFVYAGGRQGGRALPCAPRVSALSQRRRRGDPRLRRSIPISPGAGTWARASTSAASATAGVRRRTGNTRHRSNRMATR